MTRLLGLLSSLRCLLAAIALLWAISAVTVQARDNDAIAKAFEYAQLASLSESAIGLNASLALASRANGAIAALEAERRAAIAALARTERAFENAIVEGDTGARQKASEERARLIGQIERTETVIRQRDPAYWDLVHPEAISLAGVQKLLAADEALLFVLTLEKKSYSFAVTADGASWSRIDGYGSAELGADVDSVRAGIREELDGYAEPGTGIDSARAMRIHTHLVAPIAPALAGKRRLLVVTSGPLSALPLGLLPEASLAPAEAARWMADSHVIISLASVSTLRAQRCLLVSGARRHPGCAAAGAGPAVDRPSRPAGQGFLGIGNPVLGEPGKRSAATAPMAGGPAAGDSVTGDWVTRGVANRAMLLRMASLPGTKAELDAAAQSFGPSQSRLLMGEDAVEPKVRHTLSALHPRLISFATHGLLASETGPLAEPGLVLTPPPATSEAPEDDGFLSASEIAQLDLGSAVVILSACNTGTEERALASRNLNSLARAFQYAGAAQVIASHWAVSDDATARLMAIFMAKVASDPAAPVDIAFHDAQRELRSDPRWTSPAFWAPFSIIGIGP